MIHERRFRGRKGKTACPITKRSDGVTEMLRKTEGHPVVVSVNQAVGLIPLWRRVIPFVVPSLPIRKTEDQ